jgi:hypothetical protein
MSAVITPSAIHGSPRNALAAWGRSLSSISSPKNMELDADACAIRMLKLTKEPDVIERARTKMLEFGNLQTGAYYPTGVQRAGNIVRSAAQE